MKHSILTLVSIILLVALASWFGYAQGGTSSSLSGVIIDQSGGVIPGANVRIKDDATGAEFKAVTAENGTFSIPSLAPGTYTATVAVPNFKQAIVKDIKLIAGTPANIRVTLQVGGSNETVLVEGGAEVVQTQTANITATMVGSQLTKLPLATRNILDFLILLPDVTTTSGARNSTVAGLPSYAINVTIDGINTQDMNSPGFFSYVSPRLDAMAEVTLSSATAGAESTGQGAVQIKFVTRSGDNGFHGSLYEFHRNPVLNANYWFNNRDLTPPAGADPTTWKAPRDRVLLNQFGGRVGGPIMIPKLFNGRDKAFFFMNLEEIRYPSKQTRTRTILNPLGAQGIFQYTVPGATQQKDLLALAAANGQTSTLDPTIQKLLADIRNATTKGSLAQQTDPNYQYFYFQNKGIDIRIYPTVRFDFNLTSKHRLEVSWNYQSYHMDIDFLNSSDPAFPGFPNHGADDSNRFSGSAGLRSTLTARLVNEARTGIQGGTIDYFPDVNAAQFTGTSVGNQEGFALGISAAGISNAYVTSGPSRTNNPFKTFADTLTWTKSAHSLSFGGSFSNTSQWSWSQTVVPSIGFGLNTTYDPAAIMFNAANAPKNFPGASSSQLTTAQNIYALLTGRVTSVTGTGILNESTNQYEYNGPNTRRIHQREIGVFAQDSWRVTPGLTLNYGLRYELQFPVIPLNSVYSYATLNDLWGVSGIGNLFKPNVMTGQAPQFTQFKAGSPAYNSDKKALGPSFGFAWSPNAKEGWLRRIIGSSGQTVLRSGYSLAFNRYGMGTFSGIMGANPGLTVNATRNVANGNLVSGVGSDTWPLLFRQKDRLGPPSFLKAPAYPLSTSSISDAVRIFDPNIRTPYTQSWMFSLQREITKSTALEVRYSGNRNLQSWVSRNLNEQNLVENGFLNEFKNAMANLQANMAAGRGNNFKYYGPDTGTYALPITLAYFSGIPASQASDPTKYTSTNFTSTTWVGYLAKYNPVPYSYESGLWTDATRRANAAAAGIPANLFVVNPDVASGGAMIQTNGGFSRYDSMVVELRRRLSRGLLVQANYTFAKSFSGSTYSFRAPWVNVLGNQPSHAFKVNWLYELPFGSGKLLFGNSHGVLDRFIGGWEFQGTGRIQSGNLISFGNVRVVGMTMQELRDAVALRFDDANRLAYYLPADIIANTYMAYNTSATTSTGYSSLGVPSGRYLAPANSGGCIQVVTGDCAPQTVYFRGPKFTRFDLSLVKRIRFSESKSFELRGEFLDAFNNVNFWFSTNNTNFSSATWGQVTTAYTDRNQQYDTGGRLIQIAVRINF
jgi:hypothetical protein